MSASLTPSPLMQFFDSTGAPLSGGTLSTFIAGTSTPLATYTDSSGSIANNVVITLNTRGEAAVWLDSTGIYKFVLKDAAGVLIWTADNIEGQVGLADLTNNTDATKGSALVGYAPGTTGAVGRTVQSSLRDRISAFDFMTAAQIADVQARTETQDVTAPLQAFFNACKGGRGYLPPGTYKKTAQITMDPAFSYDIEGAGWASDNSTQGTIIKDTTGCNGLYIYYSAASAGPPAQNSDVRVRLSQMSFKSTATTPLTQTVTIEGAVVVMDAGTGIWMYWVNGLLLEDVWISGYPADGIYGYRCFTSLMRNVWAVQNWKNGIHLSNTANAVRLTGIKSLGNGKLPTNVTKFGILIDSTASVTYTSLAPVIDGATDVSYGGGNAAATRKISNATLTSIVVLGGTATINATAHAFNVGDKVAINGGVSTEAQINTIFAATVLTKATNSFTVATTAANATYNGALLLVAPFVSGVGLGDVFGADLSSIYSEECTGAGIYISAEAQAFSITGGYFQNNKIVVDYSSLAYYAQDGRIQGAYMSGYESGIYQVLAQGCVIGKNTLANNATNYVGGLPTLYKKGNGVLVDGMHVGPGTWTDYQVTTNSGVGVGVLANVVTTLATDGIHNTALGYYALNSISSGYNNTAVGYNALPLVATGVSNTAVGARAGDTVTTTTSASTYIGFSAGSGVLVGAEDVMIGVAAGLRSVSSNLTGSNVFVGNNAGRVVGTVDTNGCVVVGWQAGGLTAAATNFIGIGKNTYLAAADNRVQMGDTNISSARVQVAWTIVSDRDAKENIKPLDLGLAFICSLQPVSYNRIGSDDEELGLIAQDVEAALPRPLGLVSHDAMGYGLRKDDLIAVLIKAVQELEARVVALEAK
jgi:hypothetical protein